MVSGAGKCRRNDGFTIVELLVVLAATALLLSVAAPRYVEHLDRARDAALRENLLRLRESIDKFYTDHARYPDSLQELVDRRYLRAIPIDPVTGSGETWVLVRPNTGAIGTVSDVKSAAPGDGKDGTSYASW